MEKEIPTIKEDRIKIKFKSQSIHLNRYENCCQSGD